MEKGDKENSEIIDGENPERSPDIKVSKNNQLVLVQAFCLVFIFKQDCCYQEAAEYKKNIYANGAIVQSIKVTAVR